MAVPIHVILDSQKSTLESIYFIASIIGGVSTTIGVGIAIFVGLISRAQFFNQRSIEIQREYSNIYQLYLTASQDFFSTWTGCPDVFNYKEFSKFLSGFAKIVHYLDIINKTSKLSPSSFSKVDYIFLSNDIDSLDIITKEVMEKYNDKTIDTAVKQFQFDELRSSLGSTLTSQQDSMLKEFEQRIIEAAGGPTSREEDEKLFSQIKSSMEAMFPYKYLKTVGIEENPELFHRMREAHQLFVLLEVYSPLSEEIHEGFREGYDA